VKLLTVTESGPNFEVNASFEQRRDDASAEDIRQLTIVVHATQDMPVAVMAAFAIAAADICAAKAATQEQPDQRETPLRVSVKLPPAGPLFHSVA
jgi:hypothetical protein